MKKSVLLKKSENIYFIGAGGVFMSALIKHCLLLGKNVSGSDKERNEYVEELEKSGVKIFIGHDGKNLKSADMVVYSSAIGGDNPELVKARKLKIPVFKRSEFLAIILKDYTKVIAVAGCHGKTTTAAMITHVLKTAGESPTAFIGGVDNEFSNYLAGERKYLVTEACEYKKNFLDFKPDIAVITNIDNDHMDSFDGETDLINSFSEFSNGAIKIINSDDERSKMLADSDAVTFGIKTPAVVKAENVRKTEKGYAFTLVVRDKKAFRVRLNIAGRFNVYNALATFSVCLSIGINLNAAKRAVENFSSVKRRLEFLGVYKNKKIYADYAHHPSEIKAVLSVFDDKCLTVFQPHTYSRTKNLKKEFTDVLSARNTVIYKTYPAREKYDKAGDGYSLYLNLKKNSRKNVYYAKNEAALIKAVEKGDEETVVFVGAGDIYYIAKKLFARK